jgi:anti-sigma factor RsiW
MMGAANEAGLSDEKLVAYLDGELSAADEAAVAEALSQDAEARERLELLRRGGRPFGEAFDLLLHAAPDEKLQAMFAELLGKNGAAGVAAAPPDGGGDNVVSLRPQRDAGRTPLWRMAAAAAILALVFTGGLATGGFFDEPAQIVGEKPGWREAAARYVALFSRETLEGMPADTQQRRANLQRIETALGLPLPGDRIVNPELAFQGTQLLQLEGKALAQISYLYDGSRPVALCIIRTANPAAAPARETRHGLNIVHWVANGYGFMVIGDVPEGDLERIAQTFQAQFS